jgi:hypothetical protein
MNRPLNNEGQKCKTDHNSQRVITGRGGKMKKVNMVAVLSAYIRI